MAGPPKDVEPDELFRLLTTGDRPSELVDYPRLDPRSGKPIGQVRVVVLTQEEQEQVVASAEASARKRLRDPESGEVPHKNDASRGYDDLYDNECAVELVWRAVRSERSIDRFFFPSTRDIRKMPAVEIGVLLNHYYETQSRLGPIISTMTEAEYKAWAKVLATGADGHPLGRLSWGLRTHLVLRLARDAWRFLTGSTSSGSPAASPTDAESSSTTTERPSAPPTEEGPVLAPSLDALRDTLDE